MPELPMGWREEPLGEVAAVRVSNVDKKSRPFEIPVRLCNYLDAYREDYLDESHPYMAATATPSEVTRFGLRAGDVIVTKDSETPDDIGVAAVIEAAPDNLVCGYHLAIVRPTAQLNPVWLAKQFGTIRVRRYLAARATGSTRYGLSNATLSNVPMFVPLREEQDRIVEVLRTLDVAMRCNEQLTAKLQKLKQGLLHDLLTRGIDENGAVRPISDERPDLYAHTTVGLVPKGWDVGLLDSFATRGSGHTPNKNVRSYWDGGIKWVSLADSERLDKVFIQETDKEISELGIANSSAVKHTEGTVILSRDAGVGKSAILAGTMAVSQHFMAWSCGPRLNNVYLYYWLQHAKPRFEAIAMGSTIKTIGLPYFRKLEIAVPTRREQDAVAIRMLDVDRLLWKSEADLDKLGLLKAGLVDDLLTGRIRVDKLPAGSAA